MIDRPRHPSGRPIRRQETKGRSMWRVPDVGYVTPRLNRPPPVQAIGFTTPFLPGHQSDEDDQARRDGGFFMRKR